MAKNGNKVSNLKIPLMVTIMESDAETIVLVQSETADRDGRIWATSASGKGKTFESAIDDLQADMARKPMQIAGIVRRMIEGSSAEKSEPNAEAKIGTKAQQADISEAKELKELMRVHDIKIKFPFGATRELRKKLVMDAIDAQGGKKKEAF